MGEDSLGLAPLVMGWHLGKREASASRVPYQQTNPGEPAQHQSCLRWHLSPRDGSWVREFLLFRKVTYLTCLSTNSSFLLSGMGLCYLTRMPPPSFVSALREPGQALDAAHLERLFTLWLSLKTDHWAPTPAVAYFPDVCPHLETHLPPASQSPEKGLALPGVHVRRG